MDRRNLTVRQAEAVRQRVKHQLDYVTRLVERMKMLRFPENDTLWTSALKSMKALTELHGELLVLAKRRDRP